MEKRILRPRKEVAKENVRSRKEATKENVRPAKRIKRAISTIECPPQMKAAQVAVVSKQIRMKPVNRIKKEMLIEDNEEMIAAQVPKISSVSTQTDCCLAATNAQLVQELIAKNNLLQRKDQKYIEMLETFYMQKERLTKENREKSSEIAQLTQRLQLIETEPLIGVANNGKSHTVESA